MVHFGAKTSDLIVKLFERTCTSVRCVARFSFDFLFNLRHFLAFFCGLFG